MKTRLITDSDPNKVEDRLGAIVHGFNEYTKYTIQFSTCPYGPNGTTMYSALIVWS